MIQDIRSGSVLLYSNLTFAVEGLTPGRRLSLSHLETPFYTPEMTHPMTHPMTHHDSPYDSS